MSPSCPISTRRVDTNLVRVVSFQVLLFTLLFAVTQIKLFIFIMLFDFIVRALRQESYSLFAQTGKLILKQWKAVPKYSDEAPKRFALCLGLAVTLMIILFSLLGFAKMATAIAFILMICAFLEVLFDFCIGCKLYYALQLCKVRIYDRNFN